MEWDTDNINNGNLLGIDIIPYNVVSSLAYTTYCVGGGTTFSTSIRRKPWITKK